ncbi:hypothetical protein IU412_17950, partial [Nocardia cyriacigeorgica]|nr:hypothetical protein [Nocardia cyriacigeorgica]
MIWIAALLVAAVGPAAAVPGLDSGSAAAATGPRVDLNAYCDDHGAVGHLEDGTTVYCTQVQRTDAFVWSLSRNPIPRDPNTRGYTCDDTGCHYPDGSEVPSNDQNLWIPGGRAFPEDDRRSHRILIKTSVGALAGRHARAHG